MLRSVTSESVTEGHPDKVCDKISDAILDFFLRRDPTARVACETMVTNGLIVVSGEVSRWEESSKGAVEDIVRRTIEDIGYVDEASGFCDKDEIILRMKPQSDDIKIGVDEGGAGDQGMMFGYATDETETYMPLPIALAHRLCERLTQLRKDGTLPWLRPDGKSQVTVEYDAEGRPEKVKTVVLAAQHSADQETEAVRQALRAEVVRPVLGDWMNESIETHINRTSRFVLGGPEADVGLTGRKIIVDTYGGVVPHGGGAFSGKDPTKVDRSAAYALRWIAKNLVAAGVAKRLLVGASYVIGHRRPLSVSVDAFGSDGEPPERIEAFVRDHFDLTPLGIIKRLDLQRPIYEPTAAYGHFGRTDVDLPWEALDEVDAIKERFLAVERAS